MGIKFHWPFQSKSPSVRKVDRTPTLKQLTNSLKSAAVKQMIDDATENPELLREYGAQFLKIKPKDLGDEALRKALAEGDIEITQKVLDAKIKRMGLGARDDPMEQLVKWKTFLAEFEGPKRSGGFLDFLTPEIIAAGIQAFATLQQQNGVNGTHNNGITPGHIRKELPAPHNGQDNGQAPESNTEDIGDYMFGPELDTFIEEVLDRLEVGAPAQELAEFVIYELNRIGVELQKTDPSLEKFSQVRGVIFMPPSLFISTLRGLLESRPEYGRVLQRLNMPGGEQDIKDFCNERDLLWDKLKKEQGIRT